MAATRTRTHAAAFAFLGCLVAALGGLLMPPTPAVAGERSSIDLRATYDVSAALDWDEGTITVRSEMEVTNTSGGPIDRLELNTVAGPLGEMVITESTVDGAKVEVTVQDQTLLVELADPLVQGGAAAVVIAYDARFRAGVGGRSYFLTRANGIMSAYRWIPWITRQDDFWASPYGDPFTTAVSPYIRVSITADRQLRIASTGSRVSSDGLTQVFEARDVRDFVFTAAPDLRKLSGWSIDGDTRIVAFSRTLSLSVMFDYARRAMDTFESKLGQYPYDRFTVSEASGGSAMESPGHIWLPAVGPKSHIGYLTVHETGHQWFYGIVGNDQPGQPFADEAVVEFLTRWFEDAFGPSSCPRDRLDGGIGYYQGCIFQVIYAQGSTFLDGVKRDMGASRFWAALREYVADHRFRFGGTPELLETLRLHAQAVGLDLTPRLGERFPRFY